MLRLSVVVALAFALGILSTVGFAATHRAAKWPPSPNVVVVSKWFTADEKSNLVGGEVNCPAGYDAMGFGWDSWTLGWVVIWSNPMARPTRTQSGAGYILRDMSPGIHGSATGWTFSARRAATPPQDPPDADNRIMVGVTCLKYGSR